MLTVREFLQIVKQRLEGLPEICHHPKETVEDRAAKLAAGLAKLGIE